MPTIFQGMRWQIQAVGLLVSLGLLAGCGSSTARYPVDRPKGATSPIYEEPESFAADMLEAEGVTRLDVVSYLAHGVSKLQPAHGFSIPAGDDEDEPDPDNEDCRRRFDRNRHGLVRNFVYTDEQARHIAGRP